jgi:serine/threonine protein kinase/class 3 adenylate cyclase
MVLMFTDIVGSTDLKRKHGDTATAKMIRRHDELFRYTVGAFPFAEILKDVGDGFLARFNSASDAVHAALHFQRALHDEKWDHEIRARVGVHLGEVSELDLEPSSGKAKISGLAVDITARVMALALPGQILMTRAAFDNARQYVREHPSADGEAAPIVRKWMAHGRYMFKGAEEPLEIFEVGETGIAPLKVPPDNDKAKRSVAADQEETLGWRPAVGMEIPDRKNWILDRKLGEGGFGEVWLGEHTKTKTRRVFKFCFDAERLRSFKRELMLFRLLRDALGDRSDIAKLHEVQVEQAPFYLESEFTEDGSLVEWSAAKGGIDKIPLATRLDLVARTALAVSAAHSVGILHKDIKPSNILIYRGDGGEPMPRLTDFGIGVLTDPDQLKGRNITMVGMTESLIDGNESSRTGTRIYAPPETLMGKPFTMQGDVYALGILLYQMVVADLERPLAQGWEREVPDPLLREDIAACVEGHESERLSSAKELAERLQNLPARKRARQRKRIARASAMVSVLLVVMLSLTIGVLVRENGLRKLAQAEEAKAKQETAKAKQMLEFCGTMFRSVDPYKPGGGRDVRVVELFDIAVGAIDDSLSDPQVAAAMRAFMGRGYKDLGLFEEAEQQLVQTVNSWRAVGAPASPDAAQRLEDLAATYYWQYRFDAAKPVYEEALAMRTQLHPGDHEEVARSLNHLAACLDRMCDPQGAEGLYRQALEMRTRLATDGISREVVASMNNLSSCLRDMGKLDEADALSRRALEILEIEFKDKSSASWATTQSNLARVLAQRPDSASNAQAMDLYRQSLEAKKVAHGEDHPNTAITIQWIGELMQSQGDLAGAEKQFREALHLRETRLQDGHLWIAESRGWLGKCLAAQKRYDEAEPLLTQSYNSYVQVRGALDCESQEALKNLVDLYTAWGKPDKASEYRAKQTQTDGQRQVAAKPS